MAPLRTYGHSVLPFLAVIAVLLVVPSGCCHPAAPQAVPYTEGPVEIEQAGESLAAGDVVRTGPGGRTVLVLENGAVEVILLEETEVEVGSIFVRIGTVITRVLEKLEDRFDVESRYAVAGAEGTVFLVGIGPGEAYECAVLAGRVGLRSETGTWEPVTLEAGQLASGSPGAAPELRQLDPARYDELVEQVNEVERALRPTSPRLLVPATSGDG